MIDLRLARMLHYLLALVIFEGLLRKLSPSSMGIAIFFAKDALLCLIVLHLIRIRIRPATKVWLRWYFLLCLAFVPPVVLTMDQDVLLGAFGASRYLLYPWVAIAVLQCYSSFEDALSLIRYAWRCFWFSATVTFVQFFMPSNHWLNLSPSGESLEAFSAGGHLRLSSTFSFVGQHVMFLNFLAGGLGVLAAIGLTQPSFIVRFVAFVASLFMTGSRSAVLGTILQVILALTVMAVSGSVKGVLQMVLVLFAAGGAMCFVAFVFPEFLSVYFARVAGTAAPSHSEEMAERIHSMLTDWIHGTPEAPPTFFGYGLGVMSNGSDKLSAYAQTWRRNGFWTETDLANTLFEGGFYLIFVWFLTRLAVVLTTAAVSLRSDRNRSTRVFLFGFISVQAAFGTLAIQPPLSIWFWLATGIILQPSKVHCMRITTSKSPQKATHLKPPTTPCKAGFHSLLPF